MGRLLTLPVVVEMVLFTVKVAVLLVSVCVRACACVCYVPRLYLCVCETDGAYVFLQPLLRTLKTLGFTVQVSCEVHCTTFFWEGRGEGRL